MTPRLHLRWMIRRDMPEVLAIEAEAFEHAWDDDDFIKCLRNRNVIGMVAEHDERIIGYMIYSLWKHKLEVINFAVAEKWRRRGVGRAMMAKLASKLSHDRRGRICLAVWERNLDAQLFFRAMGFECVETLRNFEETGDDAYWFVYTHPVKQEVANA